MISQLLLFSEGLDAGKADPFFPGFENGITRGCVDSAKYDEKTKKCNSATVFGRSATFCICSKDDAEDPCNSSQTIQMSFAALALAAVFKYLF